MAQQQYKGTLNEQRYTVVPIWHNVTDAGEVKCNIQWDNGCSDFIWFTNTGTELVCQLNDKIRVSLKEEA